MECHGSVESLLSFVSRVERSVWGNSSILVNAMKCATKTIIVGKPITDEFILFLAENRDFAVNYLMRSNPDLSREDCEDIYGLFILKYLEKRELYGDSARRFVDLTRPNLISRLRWFTIDFLRLSLIHI